MTDARHWNMGRLWPLWAGLLAVDIHVVVALLARFPSIETRMASDEWDLLISLRSDPPLLTVCHEDEAEGWRRRAPLVDESLESESLLHERWPNPPEGWWRMPHEI